MVIRRAQSGDEVLWLNAVESLVAPKDRDGRLPHLPEIRDTLVDPRCYLYLALVDGNPIGLLNAFRFPNAEAGGEMVYLYDIEVNQHHRRAGAGASLVTALVQDCRRDGVRLIWAGTDVANVAARKTFESTGAELDGESYAEYEWDLVE